MRHPAVRFALPLLLLIPIPAAAAPEEDPIQAAIARGVKYLKGVHKPGPAYHGGTNGMGTATLAGLALLEAGVPETDPSLHAITEYVRNNALSQTRTYELSLTIMFLDRLGKPGDRPMIQLLGVRLMGGQGRNGGWTYDCGNPLTAEDESRLRGVFQKESRMLNNAAKKEQMLTTEPPKEPVPKDSPEQKRNDLPAEYREPEPDPTPRPNVKKDPPPKKEIEKPVIHPEVRNWAKLINVPLDNDGEVGRGRDGDNSNTQFAILGIWCARRHGLKCDKTVALFEKRFRASQCDNGGWGYHYAEGGFGATATMTCAGLLGLAVAHGSGQSALKNRPDNPVAKRDPKADPNAGDDEAIQRGLKCLGEFITAAKGLPPEGLVDRKKRGKKFKADNLNSNYYFLWSIERVAVIFGLETIGNHDWYAWGADALIDMQLPSGAWGGGHYHGANEQLNTSFALLFLSRANVARDLSQNLKGQVKDPGVSALRFGGDPPNLFPKPKKEPVSTPEPPNPPPIAKTEPRVEPGTSTTNPAAATEQEFQAEAGRLVRAVVDAAGEDRAALLVKLRDSKGSVNTEALARLCARLGGEAQQAAREALARRLTRMTAATLREMLRDDNHEIRRAAALACGYKEDQQFVPALIEKLADPEALVVQAAVQSLRGITRQDFGPDSNSPADKTKAILAWRAWWKMQNK